jgi:hypothetical protein
MFADWSWQEVRDAWNENLLSNIRPVDNNDIDHVPFVKDGVPTPRRSIDDCPIASMSERKKDMLSPGMTLSCCCLAIVVLQSKRRKSSYLSAAEKEQKVFFNALDSFGPLWVHTIVGEA